MKPLLVHPSPAPELTRALDAQTRRWIAVQSVDELALRPATGWGGAVISIARGSDSAWQVCKGLRSGDDSHIPIVVVVGPAALIDLEGRQGLFDDFCVLPIAGHELELRISRIKSRLDDAADDRHLIGYGQLQLNTETYEATIAGRALGLTHLEYELLRHLATTPGRVFTREVLLNQVWGYDYFGGARTVDVHVRRLRSKLGTDHADMIQTVRSVGYYLGAARRDT